jgi:hypothetical protein
MSKFTPEERKAEWASYKPPVGVSGYGCFGFVNGHLILGKHHHQAIMAHFIANGWTWEDLMTAEQIWGWYSLSYGHNEKPRVDLNFVSDAAYLHRDAVKPCKAAFKKLFGVTQVTGLFSKNGGDVVKRHGTDYGGDYDRHYKDHPDRAARVSEKTPIPEKVPV